MAELTLQDVFGAGATQNSTSFTIFKADIANLTATSNNSPDQLVVGLLNLFTTAYPQSVWDGNPDVSVIATLGQIPGTTARFNVTPVTTPPTNLAYTVYNYSLGITVLLPSVTPSPNDV